jgi:hypothetical protein
MPYIGLPLLKKAEAVTDPARKEKSAKNTGNGSPAPAAQQRHE